MKEYTVYLSSKRVTKLLSDTLYSEHAACVASDPLMSKNNERHVYLP
jgi:hypothetical protein